MNTSDITVKFPLHNLLLLSATQVDSKHSNFSSFLQQTTQKCLWEKSVQMAYVHAVLPQFYTACKPYQNEIPPKQFKLLEKTNKSITFENIKLSAELIKITTIFKQSNISYISIKGPALSQDLYKDITVRQICDLDLLVSEGQLLQASQLLIKMGYESKLSLSLLDNSGFIALDNDFTFLHPDKKIMVELHWMLFPSRHKMPLDFEMLYKNINTVVIQKQAINILINEHNLLYLALHASKHLFEQLKWVCDIDRLVRNNNSLNFTNIFQIAKELKVLEPFLLGLLITKSLYNTPLPPLIDEKVTPTTQQLLQSALKHFRDDFTTLDEPTKKRIRFLFLQQLNQDRQNRYLALIISTFKPSSVDYIYYQLPPSLNFLYYFLRPLRLFYKYAVRKVLS